MSFDQNMIIDATTGSIARFVNHSCNPNCRMVKWIVSGQPRMALFAGDNPIFTGDELTYDYNFDPFSAKNVQKCLCGSVNCRGVLGPKKSEVKPIKTVLKNVVKASVKAGKRKLAALVGEKEDNTPAKKRKIQPAKGSKKPHAPVKAVKGAAAKLKQSVARMTGRKKTPSSKLKANSVAAVINKVSTKRIIKTYGKTASRKQISTKASTTLAVKGKTTPSQGKTKTVKTTTVSKKSSKPVAGAKGTASRRLPVKKTPAIKVAMKSPSRTKVIVKKSTTNEKSASTQEDGKADAQPQQLVQTVLDSVIVASVS